jgi:hypothetical protein
MNIVINPLDAFYITGAIILLALAILLYPTIKERSQKKSSQHR